MTWALGVRRRVDMGWRSELGLVQYGIRRNQQRRHHHLAHGNAGNGGSPPPAAAGLPSEQSRHLGDAGCTGHVQMEKRGSLIVKTRHMGPEGLEPPTVGL